MLLPRQIDEESLDIDDPRIDLVAQLLEYRKYKNIAHKLKNLHFENKDSFFRSSSKVVYDQSPDVSDFLNEVTLFDISKIFKDAVDNAPTQDTFEIYREIVSLKEKKNFILQQFKTNKIISLKKLVKKLETKIEIIVMLSNAALEVLAIISYKQPISRIDIETIRGVDCKGVLKNLLSKSLIKIQGRDDSIGKALLYKTTDDYLKHFGISNLNEMPTPDEVTELVESEDLS